ncbi:hypothetical protein A5886_001647 [Enterococcus sp. 8G7_MSG3316]|uniref:Transcobalamin-like C-terminal domain-containing protein n=1 Tax=Candidatus Enterococcus testudinis TaxID=1834191 RepID=A0A242A6P8_9ENTE|nr:DUF4430 domain-containing protein [Enterococcus sp. 8G7_MSG3316]OTN76570.1 hypothetical protein A5886_001647 [Enterococcus sp. 8G7_MSG3316]
MKQKIMISYVLLLSLLLVGCAKPSIDGTSTSTEASSAEKSATQRTAEISFVNNSDDTSAALTDKTVTFEEGTTLMTIMKDNFELVEDQGMITSIDGLAQDEGSGYYWTYTINDEMINTGANDTFLGENDQVVFTYEKFE